jgi:tape measure domain-containing protein
MMDTLRILGNAASGTSTPFGFLALVFNQVRGVGRLLTQDFRQLSSRGVISLQEIANYYGVTTQAAQQMLSKGEISFTDLRNILKKASEDGGKFANLMEKQSESLLGKLSTLKDAIGITARTIGEVLLPMAKQFIEVGIQTTEGIRNWVENHKYLTEAVVNLATAYFGLRVAILGVNTAMKVLIGLGASKMLLKLLSLLGGAATAGAAGMAGGAAATGGALSASRALAAPIPGIVPQWAAGFAPEVASKATWEYAASLKSAAGALSKVILRTTVWGTVAATTVYMIYDWWASNRKLNDELERGANLEKDRIALLKRKADVAKAAASEERARDAEAKRAGYLDYFDMTVVSGPERRQRREEEVAGRIPLINKVNAEAAALENKWTEIETKLNEQASQLTGAQYQFYRESLYRQAGAEVGQIIDEIVQGTQAVREGWTQAEIQFQKYIEKYNGLQNKAIGAEQQRRLAAALRNQEIATSEKSMEELRTEVEELAAGYDDITRATLDWGRANKTIWRATGGDVLRERWGLLQRKKELEDQKQAREHLKAEGKTMTEQLLTPAEEYEAKMEKIKHLLQERFITPETAKRARERAGLDLAKAGSSRTGMGTGFMSASDFGRRLQESLLQDEENKKQTKALNDIDAKLGESGPLVKAVKATKATKAGGFR